jgi:hypothetical protein
MASSLIKLETLKNLAPGQEVTRNWNRATPSDAVWYIQAIPLLTSFTDKPKEQSVEVEVTRIWRKLIRTAGKHEFEAAGFYEHEIWYVVKNIGQREVDVDVYASITKSAEPPIKSPVEKQYGGTMSLSTGETDSLTVTWTPDDGVPKDVTAEIALIHVKDFGNAAITKMVSTEAGVETDPAGIRFRKGVSLVEFTLMVSESGATARWRVNEHS